jgi:putative transposase
MTQNKSSEKFGEDEVEALLELENFIASNPDSRELKRALAVRMLIEGNLPRNYSKNLGSILSIY